MSERASRGMEFEVRANTKLDAEAAAKFRERREATAAENERRKEQRHARDGRCSGIRDQYAAASALQAFPFAVR